MKPIDDKYISAVNPPSQILPAKEATSDVLFKDTVDRQVKLWKNLDPKLAHQYNKGAVLVKGTGSDRYEPIIGVFLNCMFQCIRDHLNDTIDNVEERQDKMIQVSAIQGCFSAALKNLEINNFKLEQDSVVPIIHGYINSYANIIATNHESRQRPKN